jgi:hypothetical protein
MAVVGEGSSGDPRHSGNAILSQDNCLTHRLDSEDAVSRYREFVEDDLDYLYVVVPTDDGLSTELVTARQMSDRQFREWIVEKGKLHGVQILPTFGRLGMETRLALVNRLIRNGVHIYLAPRTATNA